MPALKQNRSMVAEANVKLPDELLTQAQPVARTGETADDLVVIAASRKAARRLFPKLPEKLGGMTEKQERRQW